MNALQLTRKADTNHWVIELPENLRGKELSITIQGNSIAIHEKPIVRRVSEEEYNRRVTDLRSVQLKKPLTYESTENEWYEQ